MQVKLFCRVKTDKDSFIIDTGFMHCSQYAAQGAEFALQKSGKLAFQNWFVVSLSGIFCSHGSFLTSEHLKFCSCIC